MTIAVIGHGRSPEGKRWGSKIDTCTTVVRMWDWTWQQGPDYGIMYHYGLFVLTPKGLHIFNKHASIVPIRGWLAYFGKATSGPLPGGVGIDIIDTTPWVQIGMDLGGAGLSGKLTLTRGCVAAAWAIEKAAKTKESVVLVGFDNVRLMTNMPVEESFCPEYWNLYLSRFAHKVDKFYPTGQPKTATHDMAIERPLLELLAKKYDIALHYAQDIW